MEKERILYDFRLFKEGYEKTLITSFQRAQNGRIAEMRLLRRRRNRLFNKEEKKEKREFLLQRRKETRALFLPRREAPDAIGDSVIQALDDLEDPMKLMDIKQTSVAEVNPHFKNPALWWRHASMGKQELYDRILAELSRTDLPLRDEYVTKAKSLQNDFRVESEFIEKDEETKKRAQAG
jgi:hypothetical protein